MTSTASFLGYRRPDARVGIRNHVLVVPTVICSAVVAERIAASIAPVGAALPHLAGCGQLGPDLALTHETLAAYCRHPNVGAVIVVALGCEQVVAQRLADEARRAGKDAYIVAIQSEGGTLRATAKGIDIAPGAHVHTHNVASTRGRGDLRAGPQSDSQSDSARIAEPPDPA